MTRQKRESNRVVYLLAVISLVLSCSKKDANTQCKALSNAPDRYIYPVVPGTAAWNAASSTDSLFSLCQIPSPILQNMSSAGLAQSCIEHPLQLHQFAFNNRIQGRDDLFARINAFHELAIRTDAGNELFHRYQLLQTSCINGMTAEAQGKYSLLFFYTEMLLTKDSVIRDLDMAQRKEAANVVIKKHTEKLHYGETFGISRSSGILVLASIMLVSHYQPFVDELDRNSNVKIFTTTGLPPDSSVYQPVLEHANNFAK